RAQDNPQPQSSVAAPDNGAATDDWEAVRREADTDDGASRPPDAGAKTSDEAAFTASARVFVACGEHATLPSPDVAAIVSRINQLWTAHVRVYQTVAPIGPHANAGGCIFYNREALLALMGNRFQVYDAQIARPLLYAIFAHEVGHELHHDLDASRAGVPSQVKELEADRFAGFTMQKLGIPASGLAPYWSMAGDEFGSGPSHGSSGQRVDAFRQGWSLAEWNRPETSGTVPDGAAQNSDTADFGSVAPDEPSGAP
ncbi:MAG TPA: hypothetical protein VMF50_14385, partial [Candidatus Binataceae bacterium]|nr:hypothetical protein [Candidatus Binataceae bacterium]